MIDARRATLVVATVLLAAHCDSTGRAAPDLAADPDDTSGADVTASDASGDDGPAPMPCAAPRRDPPETAPGTEPVRIGSLRRVGHRAVQNAGLVDCPRFPQRTDDVVAYDDGRIVVQNSYAGPQLFRFDPGTATLSYRAVHVGQETGNEDDYSYGIRAVKGPSADRSFFLWWLRSYQDIDGENAPIGRDAVVMGNRPVEASEGRFALRQVRVINRVDDMHVGPGRAGLDVDPSTNLVFVTVEGGRNPDMDEVLQVFRLDPATGAFQGRGLVAEPDPGDTRQSFTFVRVDPAHRVVLFGAGNSWEGHKDLLYLARYEPREGANPARVYQQHRFGDQSLAGTRGEGGPRMRNPQDAAFVESGGRLYAVVAGNRWDRDSEADARLSYGLFVYDLGPATGPYRLAQPVGRVPFAMPVESVRLVDGRLVASSRGLHLLDAAAVVAVRGEVRLAPQQVYPLPYPTYRFDTARIAGQSWLFLAAGPEGIEVFRTDAHPTAGARDPFVQQPVAVALPSGPGTLLLQTGGQLRHLGPPSLNDAGTFAAWATTAASREAIVRRARGRSTEFVAVAGDRWTSFGRPSINASGQVAFWASKAAGGEALLVAVEGAPPTVVLESSAEVPHPGSPEIADDGTLAFAAWRSGGPLSAMVRRPDGTVQTADAKTGDQPLDPGSVDVAPDGRAVFNRETWDRPDLLTLWDGSGIRTLFDGQHGHAFTRFGPGGHVVMRTWDEEIARLWRVTVDGKATALAEHRDRYGFGDFLWGAANAKGDVAFEAVRWMKGSSPPAEMGNWLHLDRADGGDPRTVIARPGLVLDGRLLADLEFVDAFNQAGTVLFTATLRDCEGHSGQAIVGAGY